MSNFIWLLDAGHGGMKDGVYTTAPAKMYVFPDGLTFYEGVNNRKIVNKLVRLVESANIDYEMMHHEELDTPLSHRVSRANKRHALGLPCIYLSMHSDCMPEGAHGKGSGFSVYTSVGNTHSDAIAEIFSNVYMKRFPQFRFRKDLSDGDLDKEENFYVLKQTHCPALLVENLFFDNRQEAEFLLSDNGQEQIALALFKSIVQTETKKPL